MVKHNRYESIMNLYRRDHHTHKIVVGEFSLEEFKYLQRCRWTWTEKLNGTNIRAILDGGIDFRGRSDAAQVPVPLMKHLRNKLDTESIRDKTGEYGRGVCLYGEGVGLGIQKGSNYGPEQFFVLFDVMTEYGWTSRSEVEDVAARLDLPVAPVILTAPVQEAVNLAYDGFVSRFGDFEAEGLVGRPIPEFRDMYGSRIIAKIKCKDFH